MGGQAGVRGYLIQALIAVLNSLNKKDKWISVSVEPNDESEKVDICWKYEDSKVKVVQVKSTVRTHLAMRMQKSGLRNLKVKRLTLQNIFYFLLGDLKINYLKKKMLL